MYLAPTIDPRINIVRRHPPFFEPLLYERAKVLVVRVAWAVVAVQSDFELVTRRAVIQHLILVQGSRVRQES